MLVIHDGLILGLLCEGVTGVFRSEGQRLNRAAQDGLMAGSLRRADDGSLLRQDGQLAFALDGFEEAFLLKDAVLHGIAFKERHIAGFEQRFGDVHAVMAHAIDAQAVIHIGASLGAAQDGAGLLGIDQV